MADKDKENNKEPTCKLAMFPACEGDCFLLEFGENKDLSFGRCKKMKSFTELYDGLINIE